MSDPNIYIATYKQCSLRADTPDYVYEKGFEDCYFKSATKLQLSFDFQACQQFQHFPILDALIALPFVFASILTQGKAQISA